MVLGILTSIAACPAIIGTTEAVRQGQKQNSKQAHRSRKANLQVSCTDPSSRAKDVNGGWIVLRDGKLWATNTNPKAKYPAETWEKQQRMDHEHLLAGYFFAYPGNPWGKRGDGYVSTISDDPPQLNWIYVDKDTYEVKYGLKADAEPHLCGPWTVSPIDRRLTFDGWEGFTVVEEYEDEWALYYDVDDDGLEEKVPADVPIMEIELTRRELRMKKGDPIIAG
ncbi:hypothetical protein BP6252_06854 [Coleophoma cylindrospora]|uniref:Uncharacterized protein n=1 Tax=Coleophoma cylindrospora TaxID=1849047 RepID=A0A3D8RFX9_9HELO|nr:hypothetical protein BP6252_06854 [Coleophoma cylindrospora]